MIVRLSYNIDSKTPVYGGGEGFSSEPVRSIRKGDTCNTSKWVLPNHIGTHIDFPYHFYENGQTIEDYPEDFWIINGEKVQVIEVEMPENELIVKTKHVKTTSLNNSSEFVIVKTGFGKHRTQKKYETHNPGLGEDFSDWILQNFKKIKIIGLDSVSISSRQHRDVGRMVHKKFLNPKKPVLIIEDMDLTKISSKTKINEIIIAPLMISNTNATLCTIFAKIKK